MFQKFSTFIRSENGAVTVDWVVLTAAIVTLAVTTVTVLNGPTGNVGDGVGDYMTNFTVGQ